MKVINPPNFWFINTYHTLNKLKKCAKHWQNVRKYAKFSAPSFTLFKITTTRKIL